MTGPEDELAAVRRAAARLRASHADRDQAIEVLKAAFVQGRLTRDELGERAGQVLAARTYGELAPITADIPAGLTEALPPSVPPRPRARPAQDAAVRDATVRKAVRVITAATVFAAGAWAAALLSNTDNRVLAALVVMATFTWFGIMMFTGAVLLESRVQKRSGRQLSPRPAPGAGSPAKA